MTVYKLAFLEDLMLDGKFQETFGSDTFRFDETDGTAK